MKRIFILNDLASIGGAEMVMRDVTKHLCRKHKVTVMTLDDDEQSFRKVFPDDVEYIPGRLKRNVYSKMHPMRYLVAIYNRIRMAYIRSRKYDVVIANKEGLCMKLVATMRAEKKLAWVHVDYNHCYWTRGSFAAPDEVKCMQRFDHVVCVSEAAADGIRNVIGDPGNLCVKYNPVDYTGILKKAEEASRISRDEKKPLFVAVGRMVDVKNYTTLAKVCARLCREFDFEVWIVGDGNQREEVERILAEENCSCVKILGMQSNPYQYMKKADCLVSTSLGESYGLVIQEALVLGIPVLSTRCAAIEECLDTKFGMIVDCNEEAIEQGMRSILENPECIENYKAAIEKEYDKEALWEKRLNEIEDLIG